MEVLMEVCIDCRNVKSKQGGHISLVNVQDTEEYYHLFMSTKGAAKTPKQKPNFAWF